MIRFEGVNKSFPDKELFKSITMTIKSGMRVGLVGANGTGKTTMLRMILKDEFPDSGIISVDKGQRLGYLPQDIVSGSEKTILQEVLSAWPEVGELEEEIYTISLEVSSDPHNTSLLDKLGHLQQQFEALDGWQLEDRAKKYLSGLGFTPEQFHYTMDTFSGGWRMRVALAGILIKQPDYLLLDEPTNHLDLDATIWLESFLDAWKGGLMMISHDRSFLDRSVNHILELERGNGTLYTGNFTKYLEEKAIRLELQASSFKNQQKKIKDTEQFIDRFRYKNTKSTQVQSRIKMLDKMDKVDAPSVTKISLKVRIPQPDRGPRKVAEFKSAKKYYETVDVYSDLNIGIERGEKIGLVGSNGAGKSTLLKMLAGVESLSEGSLDYGIDVKMAYFAQHQLEILDPEKTIYKTISSISKGWSEQEIRTYLGSFLFTGDTIEKLVKVLSGGEKSRLALARMLVEPSHLLLLDEPTNHLDMVSRDVITNALVHYSGTIVCISHDRHFLNRVTNKTIEILDGNPAIYDGNYDYFIWKKEKNISENRVEPVVVKTESNREKTFSLGYRERKRMKNKIRRIQGLLKTIEAELEKLEKDLGSPSLASDFDKLQGAINTKALKEEEYFRLLEEMETLEKEAGE